MELKAGDFVKRIKGYYGGMDVGDVDCIEEINGNNVTLKHFGNGHSSFSFSKYHLDTDALNCMSLERRKRYKK